MWPSCSSGSEIAGVPSSDAGTFIEVSPVEPRPTGAAPVAPSVTMASSARGNEGVAGADILAAAQHAAIVVGRHALRASARRWRAGR